MTAKIFKRLPGVLSFQRGLLISDALFYNGIGSDPHDHPLMVVRHGLRGVQNINKGSNEDTGAVAATAKRQEISNIQITDSAKLATGADTLVVEFSIRFLDLKDTLFACAAGVKDSMQDVADLRQSVSSFIDRAKQSEALSQLSGRYARNITNARWLWRNRVIASTITTEVCSGESLLGTFDSLAIPLNDFESLTAEECAVASAIAAGLRGDTGATLNVAASVKFGATGPLEVFPSQNYMEEKPKGFARSLYFVGTPEKQVKTEGVRIMGQAAYRDQKVSNAIRTIDTWYPGFADAGRPIAVEPLGASLADQVFYREKGTSAFVLMRRLNEIDPVSPEGQFMLACLIRGGVYSEGAK